MVTVGVWEETGAFFRKHEGDSGTICGGHWWHDLRRILVAWMDISDDTTARIVDCMTWHRHA